MSGSPTGSLTIGDTAPDFEAETTEGTIDFHDWAGDSWVVLFSHPRNFTPVCTTELGYMASVEPEFARRGVKVIGLSVDPVDNHAKWSEQIASSQGTAPNPNFYYLAGAPPDDEPLTDEDLAAAREALGDLAAGRLVDLDELTRELG